MYGLKRIKNWWQYIIPKQLLTYLAGRLATSTRPWLKNWLIRRCVSFYRVDLSRFDKDQVKHYEHFNAFFTRALKEPHPKDFHHERQVISPVEGRVNELGIVENQSVLQAKKRYYTLDALLCDQTWAQRFKNGSFMTINLEPGDYHRVHMPCEGELEDILYVPGTLFSVSRSSAGGVAKLYTRNERVILTFQVMGGWMAIVLVGSLLVGQIELTAEGPVMPLSLRMTHHWSFSQQQHWRQGSELARFLMGSCIILLFSPDLVHLNALRASQRVKLFEKLGELNANYRLRASSLE